MDDGYHLCAYCLDNFLEIELERYNGEWICRSCEEDVKSLGEKDDKR